MAVKYQKQYTSQASAIYDIAKSKSAFNQQTYDDLAKVSGDQALVYLTLLSSASKEDLEQKVDLGKLNLLNSNLQLSYLYNELQQDKSETAKDAQGNLYNVYDAQKEYLDYEYNRALNLQVYNSLDGFIKSIYSVGGAVADAFTQVYGIIENIIDAGASVGGWIASLAGDTETADDIRKFIKEDITGKDSLQKDVDNFISTYTVWDKNNIARGLREAGQSIARMAPMIIAGALTGGASAGVQLAGKIIGTGMYYGAMAGQTTEETFRTQPEISWNNAMGYTLATTAIEAGTEFLSDKIFGSDVISRLAFGGTAARSALSELGMSLFTEGLEEATSEILDSLVYQQLVDKDAPLASFEDVLHAAVIGSLVGGLMTGGSIATTARTYVDTQTGKMYSAADIDKMMETSNVKSYKDLKNIKRLGRVKSYNLKSILNAMPEVQPTEMQKLKAKYDAEFKGSTDIQTDIKNKYSKEYQRAVETDARAQEKAVATAVKLSKFAEAIGIENFRNATKLLENAREKALTLVDKFQNANNGRTEAEQQAKVNFEKENPGYTFSPVESMTNEEKYIDKVLYDNYKVHLYVGEIGSESGVDYNDLHTTPNAVYVKSGTINSESYQSVLDNVIKQQLVQQALNVDVLSDSDIKTLELQLNGVESTELFADNKNLAFYKKMNTETLMQRLLFDDISINKVFFTEKNIFKKVYNHIKNAIKINRTKSKTDVNKIEFRVLNEIRNRYINNVAKSIGNAQDAAKAKVIMDLTPEEGVEKIDNVMLPNFINQHMLLLNTNMSSLAYEKMQVEKFLLDRRVGLDKTVPLDYNTLLNPETYGGDENEFVRSVYDAYPGRTFQDALWNYITDNYHYAISPTNQTIYKEINMVDHSRQNFTYDVQNAMMSKDSRKLRKYTKINQILNNTILNYFNKSDLDRIRIEYNNTIPGKGRTMVNPDGSIQVIINTSENFIYDAQETIYHELSHALAEIQGIPMGTSYNLVKAGVDNMSDSMVKGLANKMLDSEFLATADMDKIRKEVAFQIYEQTIGEIYARGAIRKFSKGTDYFEIVGNKILGRGKYAIVNGSFFMLPYTTTLKVSDRLNEYSTEFTRAVGIKKSNLESLNIDLVNDLRSENMNESLLWEYINSNSVGTPDMTNKVIGYLSDNPIVKTMKDIDLVKDRYLPALQTYYKLHPEATTVNIDDALKEVSDRGNEKVTIDNKNVTVSNYLWNVTLKLSDMTTISGSKANQIILNKFTNYDKATVTQVLKDIRNNSITQEYDTATVGMEGNISRKAGEVSEGDITEDVQYREWLSEELGLGEGKRNLSQLKKSLNNSISSWLLSSGDTTGKTDLTRIVNASKEHNINRNDYFSVKDFLNAIEKAMAETDNQFKVIDKIRNNMKVSKDGKSFLSEIFTESEIEEINNYLKENEYNTKSNLKAKLLRTVSDDVKAQVIEEFDKITSYSEYEQLIEKYTKKAPEKSAEESILTTKDEESLEAKKEVSEPKIEEKPELVKSEKLINQSKLTNEKSQDIAQGIIDFIVAKPEEDADVQEFGKQEKYTPLSWDGDVKPLNAIFTLVDNTNYDEIRNTLKSSNNEKAGPALTLFDFYTSQVSGKFNSEIQEKIRKLNQKELTNSAQRMGLQSRHIRELHPISDTKQSLQNQHKIEITVTDAMLAKYFEDLKNGKAARIAEIDAEFKKLEAKLKEGNLRSDEIDDVLDTERDLTNEKIILQNGTNEDIADYELNKMEESGVDGMTNANQRLSDMMAELIETGTVVLDDGKKAQIMVTRNDTKVILPEVVTKLTDFAHKLKTYRMWAMLSSPVTYVRNWLGNAGMKSLDASTTTLEKLVQSKIFDQEKRAKAYTSMTDLSKRIKELEKTKNDLKKNIKTDNAQLVQNQINNIEVELQNLVNQKKGAEFTVGQMSTVTKKASEDTYNYVKAKFGVIIDNKINGTEKYSATENERNLAGLAKRESALKKRYQEATGFEKFTLGLQIAQEWGLETGFFGDRKFVRNGTIKKLANIIESNKSNFLSDIKEEVARTKNSDRKALLNKALETENIEDIMNVISTEQINMMLDKALNDTMEQYFKNSNTVSKLLSEIGKKSPVLGLVTSFVMPFPKVAGNILSMAYKYSPLGFLSVVKQKVVLNQMEKGLYTGNFTGFEKADYAKAMSRATVGTLLLGIGALLSALGFIDIDDEDYLGPAIHIPGTDFRIGLANMAPSLTPLSVGASIIWAYKNDKSATTQVLSTLYDNTLLGNLDNMFQYSSLTDWFSGNTISWMSQYVPAILKLVAKAPVIGTGGAKVDKSGTWLRRLGTTLGSYIPGVSAILPKKVNPYTGESAYTIGTSDALLNLLAPLMPLDVQVKPKTKLEQEAAKLGAGTTGLTGRFTINNKDYNLSGKDKESLAKYRANYINSEYNKIVSGKVKVTVEDAKGKRITTNYNSLNQEDKAKVLKNLYSKGTEMSKIKYWTSQGNKYITTDINTYNEYRKLFGSNVQYRKTWSKSKFIEK